MSSYEAIVFDLDGTAIPNNANAVPSPRIVDTILRYRDRIHLIVATGRTPKYAFPIINALQLTNLCIISGGTTIFDPTTQTILQRTTLSLPTIHALLDILITHPYTINLDDQPAQHPNTVKPHQLQDVQIIFVGRVPSAVAAILKQAFEALPDIAASLVPDWSGHGFAILITRRTATKEQAVAHVLQTLNIAPAQAIGVGDGDNDIHLFRSVGLKVAMGNATPTLKAAADIITLPVNEDGLAAIIEQYA